MTYPAYQDGDQTGSIHHTAICREIGERIWTHLDRKPTRPSARLIGLMKRMRDSSLGFDRPRRVKDLPHASCPPDTIALMTTEMDGARSRLPHPVGSAHIKSMAETILRSTQEGERDTASLERLVL